MRGLVKHIIASTYRPLLVKYLSKTRSYSYKGITLEIPPQVFHPGFFFSTKLLLRHIAKEHLEKKRFLELGAGSGLLSIYAASKGALVTASDINPVAIQYLKSNAEENKVELEIICSDLFDTIPKKTFDLILINPPYYKKQPVSNLDYAWYCGENGEYFQKLFAFLGYYVHKKTNVFMVLCDGCDLKMIEEFADKNSFGLQCIYMGKTIIERNYIFKVQSLK